MNREQKNGLFFNVTSFLKAITIFIVTVYLLASCAISKRTYYFATLKKDTTITGLVNKDMESKIVKGDNLGINISSLNKEEDILYNSGSALNITNAGVYFPVDQEGNIRIHKLGVVKAAGYTRKELAAILQNSLVPFLKDPVVTVQYLNHKITVMGEVERPQVINMADEQMSLIDAIVLSGDVKPTARRDNVMVIREEGNKKTVKILNLENHSIFTSPWYYLQPNDIVYVDTNEERRREEERRTRFQTNFAIIVSTISLLIIILGRVFP